LRNPAAIAPVITHVLPFTNSQRGFDLIRQGKAGKIILTLPE